MGERSQTWLAEEAGIGQATVSRMLRGIYTPSPKTLQAVSQALGLDNVYLMRLSGLPLPEEGQQRDPSVEYLADRLNELPSDARKIAATAGSALGAQLDAIYAMLARQSQTEHKHAPKESE